MSRDSFSNLENYVASECASERVSESVREISCTGTRRRCYKYQCESAATRISVRVSGRFLVLVHGGAATRISVRTAAEDEILQEMWDR